MHSAIECILSRHSVRQFTGEKIKEEDLSLIVKAGMAAPSAVNIQPWAFIIVTDKNILQNLCNGLLYAKMLDKAGAAIIVCGIPSKDKRMPQDFWMYDCSAASENILLAVHALGYGAVWTAVYNNERLIQTVRKECKIPENIIPLNVIPIGIPPDKNIKAIDKYKESNVHKNIW
jgi:nitroreductase